MKRAAYGKTWQPTCRQQRPKHCQSTVVNNVRHKPVQGGVTVGGPCVDAERVATVWEKGGRGEVHRVIAPKIHIMMGGSV
jgi:hypothetical protein